MNKGFPPTDTPILFLAGEWGCSPSWYPGICFQSSLPGQEVQFMIFPWFFGYPKNNPMFHAPPFLGQWIDMTSYLEYFK
jgi:hypothetical protein